MRIVLVITFLISLLSNNVAFASERDETNLIALDENTFVKIIKSDEDSQIIQLFKVEGNKVNFVDAILVDEKKVNFKSSYEYQRLKIELK